MPLKVNFLPCSDEDIEPTIAWLNASGFEKIETSEEFLALGDFELQLRDTPPLLSYMAQIGEVLSISRITDQGVVFYITHLPLRPHAENQGQQVTSDRVDGFLFCPMNNVAWLNSFGAITPIRSKQ
ncbi:hypothetical protein [Burkholderia sp. Ax-1719]|uniref:hypothetical protein n=1 Tax=Burkholderia sp. Ax-1719 TaxID=2608334 RepID=UPI00141F9CA9|nr:hypothetical protein [Burkholderia sp. Ax-1719]NIE63226.1 hypothetical protein [Burkholderia sp. Ax-1719]